MIDFYWCSFCFSQGEKHFESCDNDNDYRTADFFVFLDFFNLSYLQNTACLFISELGFKEGD